MELNKAYNIDCIEGMKMLIPKDSIDLTLTSPPYDNLRTYNNSLEWHFGIFKAVAGELFRVTKPGGVVVWVVKDGTIKGGKTLTSFRQALYFQEIGFTVYDNIIYSKSGGSTPHIGRYRDAYEFMFIFSKGKPKTINLIADRKNKYGGTYTYGDTTVREVNGELGKRQKRLVNDIGIRFNIWEYATGKGNTTKDLQAFQHPAIFPDKLARDHILSWSNESDIVLDPFAGSGTTGVQCIELKRNYILMEKEKTYYDLIQDRITDKLLLG